MMNVRCKDMFACYNHCRLKFPCSNPKKWKEYERNLDLELLQKNPFCYDSIEFGFIVETLEHYHELKQNGHEHIVWTNRKEMGDDTNAVDDTQNIFQVSSQPPVTEPNSHKILSYNIPCSCVNCRFDDDYTFLNI